MKLTKEKREELRQELMELMETVEYLDGKGNITIPVNVLSDLLDDYDVLAHELEEVIANLNDLAYTLNDLP